MTHWTNSEVEAAVGREIQARTAQWVFGSQPVSWNGRRWRRSWTSYQMPASAPILDALDNEMQEHGLIRRSFVFGYAHSDPANLIVAVMAWGAGDADNRGAWRAAMAIGGPVGDVLADVTSALAQREDPAADAFRAFFSKRSARLPRCNVSYATKILHFFAYESDVRPRPLIYDMRVANALARIPSAPFVPHHDSVVGGDQYQRYCSWAEDYAADKGTEPIVVEYALFAVGGQLR
jgi:hypothetical protein